jgi:thiamine pyrophosphokinase
MSHVVVVIGGGGLSAEAVASVRPDVVIAADSGLDHAVAAGMEPSILVGDMDSISASGRMWAYAHEVAIDESPTEKDLTDTELALETALGVDGITDLTLLGGWGDRLDHLQGALLALGSPTLAGLESVRAWIGDTAITVLHGGRSAALPLEPGRTFSVLALHGQATGVTVTGAKWELDSATLSPTEARGVSNEAKEHTMVTVESGVVTVVVP